MPQQSLFQIDIPQTDILSYLYPPGSTPSDEPIWIDAVQPSKSLSPRQLLVYLKRLGKGLQDLGLREGDVVLTFSSNHIFIPVAYLGAGGAGCIFTGCNPAYSTAEVAFQITNTDAKLMFVDPTLLDTALLAAEKANFPRDRIYLFSDEPCQTTNDIRDWRSMLAAQDAVQGWSWRTLSGDESKRTPAVINYSSGTTGLPKGVMISHQNIIANTAQSIYMRDLEQDYTLSSRPKERWLGFLPLYHAYGQLWSISAACKTLSPCYIMKSFSYAAFLGHIQQHRITHIQTAPPILVMLAKRPETLQYDLGSLKNILCGAAPLSKELQNEVSARCGLKVVQTWGMTELTCSMLHVPGGRDDRSGSVGFIDPNSSLKLIDDEGKEVGIGERGEVHAKGPNVCMGYWRNEKATKEAFDDEGYLKTGDIAVRDEKGFYWIVDRKKELIKVKGFQVPPAELEAVLLEHEHIADAAVCGVQLEHEEQPRAYVVLQEEARGKLSDKDIHAWIGERVAKHKQLTGGIEFIDEVPKSPSGKILRKVLKEWAARDAKELKKPRAKL